MINLINLSFSNHTNDEIVVVLFRLVFLYFTLFALGFSSSAGSEDEDDEGLDPAVKVVKEKERRQANNARER